MMKARTASKAIASASTRQQASRVTPRFNSTASAASAASTSQWQPALPQGVNPAYDAALEYLSAHRSKCDAKLDQLRKSGELTPQTVYELDNVQVDGYVNDPATRALFRQTKAVGLMDRPVMRHLAERRWRKEGGLDLIMGRIFQNKVVPDILPDLPLVQPLTVAVAEGETVEPGLVLPAEKLEKQPVLTFQPFQHPAYPTASDPAPSALYTLLCVDADVPDLESHTFTQRLHYLRTDIPLSVLTGQADLLSSAGGNELVPWESICPARGTKRHRYVFVLLRQDGQSKLDYAPARENFNVRSLMATYDHPINTIAGVTLLRSEWTEQSQSHIDKIWRKVYGGFAAPHFKLHDKSDRYGYPLTPLQARGQALRERAWERSVEEFAREIGAEYAKDE